MKIREKPKYLTGFAGVNRFAIFVASGLEKLLNDGGLPHTLAALPSHRPG
jgi:hypothetical protein